MPHDILASLGGTLPDTLWLKLHGDMEECMRTCIQDCDPNIDLNTVDLEQKIYDYCGYACAEVYKPHIVAEEGAILSQFIQLNYSFTAEEAGHQASPNACPPPAEQAQIPAEIPVVQVDGLENPTGGGELNNPDESDSLSWGEVAVGTGVATGAVVLLCLAFTKSPFCMSGGGAAGGGSMVAGGAVVTAVEATEAALPLAASAALAVSAYSSDA